MKKLTLLFTLFTTSCFMLLAQPNASTDGDWLSKRVTLKNTPEAEFMYRLGDVDNLGFSWPQDFDPFCGRTNEGHSFPWSQESGEVKGMDVMLVSSKFFNEDGPCGRDGYSGSVDAEAQRPHPFLLDIPDMANIKIKDAYLLMFIDDFQAPVFCSKFQMTLNGKRFTEGELVLNGISQSGPVGKLVTMRIPEEFFPDLNSGQLTINIDETQGVGDGWAIDFIKLIVNRKSKTNCIGSCKGFVVDFETKAPIKGAKVNLPEGLTAVTREDGMFAIKDVPTGFAVATATAEGYQMGVGGTDIGVGEENPDMIIELKRAESKTKFDGKEISAGSTVTLSNILFDQGSANLREESKATLEKVTLFLNENPTVRIELSGHTSSEGDAAFNRSLSYKRVLSCKNYIVAKGIDPGRILTVGRGPDQPVAPNDTEANRALNRRVEMRVLEL